MGLPPGSSSSLLAVCSTSSARRTSSAAAGGLSPQSWYVTSSSSASSFHGPARCALLAGSNVLATGGRSDCPAWTVTQPMQATFSIAMPRPRTTRPPSFSQISSLRSCLSCQPGQRRARAPSSGFSPPPERLTGLIAQAQWLRPALSRSCQGGRPNGGLKQLQSPAEGAAPAAVSGVHHGPFVRSKASSRPALRFPRGRCRGARSCCADAAAASPPALVAPQQLAVDGLKAPSTTRSATAAAGPGSRGPGRRFPRA